MPVHGFKAPVISGGDNLRARNESQGIRRENQNERERETYIYVRKLSRTEKE